jgi:hypothetical protein
VPRITARLVRCVNVCIEYGHMYAPIRTALLMAVRVCVCVCAWPCCSSSWLLVVVFERACLSHAVCDHICCYSQARLCQTEAQLEEAAVKSRPVTAATPSSSPEPVTPLVASGTSYVQSAYYLMLAARVSEMARALEKRTPSLW